VHEADSDGVQQVRASLTSGTVELPRVGAVRAQDGAAEPYMLVDAAGVAVEPVRWWLRELVLGDQSSLTVRSYAYALLTWHRVLWFVDVAWDRAAESDTAALVGWMRSARNPQRRGAAVAGTVNVRTGKPSPAAGYSAATINLTLAAVHGFYEFHRRQGAGPLRNPVPEGRHRRRALAHRSPLEPVPPFRRGRFRQKQQLRAPRSIPDALFDELLTQMRCDRDRALLTAYVSSGVRAGELLGVRAEDLDWTRQRIWVVSKGSRELRMAPLSPQALHWVTCYLDAEGLPPAGEPIWRTRRGQPRRPLTYPAARRVLQRANEVLGTNWSLHDLRHTAATRMAGSGVLSLPDVQTVLGHRDIRTTSRYTEPRLEELCDRLADFHARPPEPARPTIGYDPTDLAAVFGA
jgi:integrase